MAGPTDVRSAIYTMNFNFHDLILHSSLICSAEQQQLTEAEAGQRPTRPGASLRLTQPARLPVAMGRQANTALLI